MRKRLSLSRRFVSAILRRVRIPRRQRPLEILFDAFNPMNVVCLRPMIDALTTFPDVRVSFMNSRERSLDTARALFTAAGYAPDQVVLAAPRTRWRDWDLYVCADHRSVRRTWIGFEFSLLDRPLFQFDHAALLFSPPELKHLTARAAYRFDNVHDLPALLDHGMRVPTERFAVRRALAEACFYKPGTATARAVELLHALARGDGSDA